MLGALRSYQGSNGYDGYERLFSKTFLPTEEKGKKVDKQMDTKRQRETVKIPPKAICQTIKMIPAEL
ncbi:hypothetical protein PV326_005053 [Microctonus aethiopoides]|nr:hypothetical protein PV326_005053 [Microctonus aethiopoides]